MSILSIKFTELEGNTIQAAAMHLFKLKSHSQVQLKVVCNCDIAIIDGVHYDWWVRGDSFCFSEV